MHDKEMLMSGFEPGSNGFGSDRFTNCASTIHDSRVVNYELPKIFLTDQLRPHVQDAPSVPGRDSNRDFQNLTRPQSQQFPIQLFKNGPTPASFC